MKRLKINQRLINKIEEYRGFKQVTSVFRLGKNKIEVTFRRMDQNGDYCCILNNQRQIIAIFMLYIDKVPNQVEVYEESQDFELEFPLSVIRKSPSQ